MKSKSNRVFPDIQSAQNNTNASLSKFQAQPIEQMDTKQQKGANSIADKSQIKIQPDQQRVNEQTNRSQEDEAEIERKQQNLLIYWLIMSMSLLFSLLNIFYFIQNYDEGYLIALQTVFFTVYILSIVFNLISSCTQLQRNVKVLAKYYFMADAILASVLCVFSAQASLIYIQSVESPDRISLNVLWLILSFLNILSMSGNFRVMMAYCKWEKWQTIIYKSLLVFSAFFSVINGCYLLINQIMKSQQEGEESKYIIAQFYSLQVLAYFSFFIELIAKMSDFDGTADLKSTYKLQIPGEEQQQKIRQLTFRIQLLQQRLKQTQQYMTKKYDQR